MVVKNWKWTERPQIDLEHLTVKMTACTKVLTSEAEMLVCFTLWPAKIQGYQKSEMTESP